MIAYDLSFAVLGFGRPEMVTYRETQLSYGFGPVDRESLQVAHACGEHLVFSCPAPVSVETT